MFTLSPSFPVQRLASFLHCLLRDLPRYSRETTRPKGTEGIFALPVRYEVCCNHVLYDACALCGL